MGIEVRVCCEYPSCEESERALGPSDDLSTTVTVDRLAEDRFHFTLDSDWVNPPEGWTLGDGDQILCPKHVPVEAGDGSRSDP